MKQNEKIKKLRIQRGFTQKELGEKAGISESTIRKYELGQRNPKFETISRIASSLGVSVVSLLDDTDSFDESLFRENHYSVLSIIDEVNYKIAPIGTTVKELIQEGYIWIDTPTASFEISKDELIGLNEKIDEYSRFLISELEKKHTEVK